MTALVKTNRVSRLLAMAFAGLALLVQATPSSAALFVSEEVLRPLQDVSIKNANGDNLYLGYKVSFHWFVLPYAVSNDGYILGAKDKPIFYSADKAKLEQWQAEGHLPNPLPRNRLSVRDYLFGHLLWIILGAVAIWYGRAVINYRRAAVAAARTASAAKVLPFTPKQTVAASAVVAPSPIAAKRAEPAIASAPVTPAAEEAGAAPPAPRSDAKPVAPEAEQVPASEQSPDTPAAPPRAAPAEQPVTAQPSEFGVAKTAWRVKQIKAS